MKVLINGCNGKMGQEVKKAVNETENMKVVCGVDKCECCNSEFPVFSNYNDVNIKIDVIIDFSIPEASLKMLEYAKTNNIPAVIATTGFNDDQNEKVKEYSKSIPIFKSSNMSYEINLMTKLVKELAMKLENSDIEIIETHHNRKIDSPSGTALMLADSINEGLNNKMTYEYDRHSKREKRSKNEIGIHSIRGGTEVGKHTVMFFGENESFEITHNCTSRNVFARGAVKAAEFIVNQNPGLYSMNDLT